ncbi:MAG: hypothetical protein H6868_05940 [Rhodospirillales bacterium]|nr:hypothetical protein [Rhodospirillales bacterium]
MFIRRHALAVFCLGISLLGHAAFAQTPPGGVNDIHVDQAEFDAKFSECQSEYMRNNPDVLDMSIWTDELESSMRGCMTRKGIAYQLTKQGLSARYLENAPSVAAPSTPSEAVIETDGVVSGTATAPAVQKNEKPRPVYVSPNRDDSKRSKPIRIYKGAP